MPIITTIYLARHAVTDWHGKQRILGRMPGIGLNGEGRAQAERLAQKLRDTLLDMIVTSPVDRAWQTAEIVNQYHHVPLMADDHFNEWGMGPWEGLYIDEIKARYPDAWKIWRFETQERILDGLETLYEVADRTYAGLVSLVEQYPGKTILIVSHKDPLRAMVCRVLDIPIANIRRLEIDMASLSKLTHDGRDFKLQFLNLPPE